MKRYIAFCIAFFLAALVCAKEIRIVSFNINGRSKAIAQIADMIVETQADIVFLQEVHIASPDNAILRKLAKQLKTAGSAYRWEYVSTVAYSLWKLETIGDETYKTGGASQNNAILYNKDKLSLTDLADEAGFTKFNGDFLFDKNSVQLVRFSLADDSDRQFFGINVHLPFTDKAHRARDLATLERLYARYKQKNGVIIAGDFNTYRRDLTKRNFDFVDGAESWYYDRNFGLRTTLSTKGTDRITFASDYDHFVYSPKITVTEPTRRTVTSTNAQTLESMHFGNTLFTNSVDFRKTISDHVPIVIVIDL